MGQGLERPVAHTQQKLTPSTPPPAPPRAVPAANSTNGMHYMLAHHIVVQHKLIEHCARRFVSITRLCTQCLFNLCCTTIWCANM